MDSGRGFKLLTKAEELLAYLRKTLGSLPVVPLEIETPVMLALDEWVRGHEPKDFELGTEAEFKDFSEEEGTIRCKNVPLEEDEIQAHLDKGKHVTKLAVSWGETLSCLLQEDLCIKRIKFSDDLKEQNDDITDDDKLARLDADFVLMSAEITRFIERLSELFGAEAE